MATHNRRRFLTSSEEIQPAPWDDSLEFDMRTLSILNASTLPDTHLPDTATTSDSGPSLSPASSTYSPTRDLHHMLSLHSLVSTTNSQAQESSSNTWRKIGAGACGAIFAQDNKSMVVKLAKGDNEALWNDYKMHTSIYSKFARFAINEVRVPERYFFVPSQMTTYFDRYPGLVQAAKEVVNLPTAALVSERIPPLPYAARTALIERYCSERIKQKSLADEANRDCLVRVYLGSMQGKSGGMFFSLRNFKLHLNQMIDLDLDVKALARRMGIALALMHWAAKTDARDVEFVLGSSAKKTPVGFSVDESMALKNPTYTGPPSCVNEDFFAQTTEMWLLDFNQVRTITLDDAGVALAIEAVKLNDPYFPKPLRESSVERNIWKEFVISYLNASDCLLQEESGGPGLEDLPKKFIDGIVELERERMQKREPSESEVAEVS